MTRAYSARFATRDLVRRIRAVDGVARVRIIPPQSWNGRRTHIEVTLVPSGANPEGASTMFTLPEARAWLAAENEARS